MAANQNKRQFLKVVDDDEARKRFAALCAPLKPRPEVVSLENAFGRVLFDDVYARVDVPGFDRSNMDGYAIKASASFGAQETAPITLQLLTREARAGASIQNDFELQEQEACPIATGGVIPRGADAVIMVEDCVEAGDSLIIRRAMAPGANIAGAGSDMGLGDMVMRRGQKLGSRETAILAAVGVAEVSVFGAPRVWVFSTGDEIRQPGQPLEVGQVYDSNSRVICDALREIGIEARFGGIVGDDELQLETQIRGALDHESGCDMILLSGGTSKGKGDLNYKVVQDLAQAIPNSAGIVVHGVALKPGKPICMAGLGSTPLVVLPGFPTSAIFTFQEFIAPELRRLNGIAETARTKITARMPMRVNSALGRKEYMLVDLVPSSKGLVSAYPLGAGSGSVSTFSLADGFIAIDRHCEYLEEGAEVEVSLLGHKADPADLIVIGSHCLGLDYLLGEVSQAGFHCKSLALGSLAGLQALKRGEGDCAGTHLLDAKTGIYNQSFLPPNTTTIGGYRRRQGLVFRAGDARFEGLDLDQLATLVHEPGLRMVNRNVGSGTRFILDEFLARARPNEESTPQGYHSAARSHNGVAAAVAQGRADWGVTLELLATKSGLSFCFLTDEVFEIAVRDEARQRPAVLELERLLAEGAVREHLAELGFEAL